MSERTLASIQRITAVESIPDADNIEVASVLGWKVVVRKGEFAVGDLAVYLEIDSVPPDTEQYHFLWKDTEVRPNNYRIRTTKRRGQISQGILFPINACDTCDNMNQSDSCLDAQYGHDCWFTTEGLDVTETLGITKYEATLPRGSSNIEGQFFDGVPKTDEERVQSSEGARRLAALQGQRYYITVKCDGASMTVAMHDGKPKVASRNYRLADSPDSAYWNAARNNGLLDLVERNPQWAIQGELVGPGIQNNRLGLKRHECLVFNVYDRDMGMYISFVEMIELVAGMDELELDSKFKTVPVVEAGCSFRKDQDDLLALAEGKYEGTTNEREGIVIRSQVPDNRISFKAISNTYLLKGGE